MAHLRMFHLGNQRFCGTHDLGTPQIPAFSGFKKPATVIFVCLWICFGKIRKCVQIRNVCGMYGKNLTAILCVGIIKQRVSAKVFGFLDLPFGFD